MRKVKTELSQSEKEMLIGLASVYGLGSVVVGKLLAGVDRLEELKGWTEERIMECGLGRDRAVQIGQVLKENKGKVLWQGLREEGVGVVTVFDKEYPRRLRKISSPPLVLFVRGEVGVLGGGYVAIVGTRKPSGYGKISVEQIVAELATVGVGVVSGMALGIDAVAHRACLDNELATVAVLGSGIDKLLPASNFGLGKEIEEKFAVVSEYAPGMPSMRQNFPARNRIVAGMAMGVVVIEGTNKSGTLITAKFAQEEKRILWALPGEMGDGLSEAPNMLLREGAIAIAKPSDVVEDLIKNGLVFRDKARRKGTVKLEPDEDLVYRQLGDKAVHVDELIKRLEKPTAWVMGVLTLLELKGLVHDVGDKEYVKLES